MRISSAARGREERRKSACAASWSRPSSTSAWPASAALEMRIDLKHWEQARAPRPHDAADDDAAAAQPFPPKNKKTAAEKRPAAAPPPLSLWLTPWPHSHHLPTRSKIIPKSKQALELASKLDPSAVPAICRQHAATLEVAADYAGAQSHYRTALEALAAGKPDAELRAACTAGVARTLLHCGDVRSGRALALQSGSPALLKECGAILEGLHQQSDAAEMYVAAGQHERAASIYIAARNFNAAHPGGGPPGARAQTRLGYIMTRTLPPRLMGGRFFWNLARTVPVLPWGRITLPQMHRNLLPCFSVCALKM